MLINPNSIATPNEIKSTVSMVMAASSTGMTFSKNKDFSGMCDFWRSCPCCERFSLAVKFSSNNSGITPNYLLKANRVNIEIKRKCSFI